MTFFEWLLLAGLLLSLGLALNLAANLVCFRPAPPAADADGGTDAALSICIPARNEAERIGPCLESLRAQTGPAWEILVLDDRSEDGTADVVAAEAARDPRIRLLHGAPLPEGWTGKAWACRQLADAARGEWLLFTDADTRHRPGSAAAALALARRGRGADLVSFWPRQVTVTWAERLVVPFMFVLLLVFLPHWMPGRRRSLGAANGQFMLFRRDAYQSMGGHGAVRGHLVDDVALARAFRAAGRRMLNRNGAPWVECRMYADAAGVWEGFSKNLRAGFESSTASFLVFHVVEFFWGLWPFLALVPALLLPAAGAAAVELATTHAVLVLGMRLAIARTCRLRQTDVLLHPLAQGAVFAIALNSWRVYAAKRVSWKGRSYPGG